MRLQVFSEALPENIRAMLADLDDNISMREEYVHSLINDFNIPLEEIEMKDSDLLYFENASEKELSNIRFGEVCGRLAWIITDRIEDLDVHMAVRLLTFCMFEEVDGEEAHELADAVLLSLINHLLTDRTEADRILNLFQGIYKWYS